MPRVNVHVEVLSDDGSTVWGYSHAEQVVMEFDKSGEPEVEGALLRTAALLVAEFDRARRSVVEDQARRDVPQMAAEQARRERG